MRYTYIAFYKPFDVLSQFTKKIETHKTLADYLNIAKDIYPVGRLDRDSEGLLLLTDDKRLNHKLLDPKYNHPRTYWVQVDGTITSGAIVALEAGPIIKVGKSMYKTQKCKAKIIDRPKLPDRIPPIRVRKSIPTSWASITLTEGKNRQVRKMFASAGFPVLRLVRASIQNLDLSGLIPGEHRLVTKFDLLNIDPE